MERTLGSMVRLARGDQFRAVFGVFFVLVGALAGAQIPARKAVIEGDGRLIATGSIDCSIKVLDVNRMIEAGLKAALGK